MAEGHGAGGGFPNPAEMAAMLARIPSDRDVISFTHGVGTSHQIFLLKMRLRSGAEETLMLPAQLARIAADGIARSIGEGKYPDVRRRRGDARKETPPIRAFLASQPTIQEADWDGAPGGVNCVAHASTVHAEPRRLYLIALLDPPSRTYRAHRLSSAISFYLLEMIEECFREKHLHFFAGGPDLGTRH